MAVKERTKMEGRGGDNATSSCVVWWYKMWLGRFRFFFGGDVVRFLMKRRERRQRGSKSDERRRGRNRDTKEGGRGRSTFGPKKRVKSDSGWKDCDSEEREEKKCYAMRKRERGNRFVVVLELEFDACFG